VIRPFFSFLRFHKDAHNKFDFWTATLSNFECLKPPYVGVTTDSVIRLFPLSTKTKTKTLPTQFQDAIIREIPDEDEQAGANIVLRACSAPLKQIAKNAGIEGEVILAKVSLVTKEECEAPCKIAIQGYIHY